MNEDLQSDVSLSPGQRQALKVAFSAALDYRDSMKERPARPTLGLDDAVDRFRQPLSEDGMPEVDVIEHILQSAEGGLHQMAAPSFFGYVLGGSHPIGVAADILVSAWGQNAGSAFETPAITGMERAVCDWVIDLLGLPPESGAGIVTGASVANMVGVMSARNALLAERGWNVEEDGLFDAPAFPVLISAHAHSAPYAALRYAGLGAGRVTKVATDAEGRVEKSALQEALNTCQTPPLVILQAGQINTGAFDPFDALIPLVKARGGWVHVDGAFGLWLSAVPELKERLAGVEGADSWAVDLHKWLNAPFDAGMVLVRDRAPLVASMSARGTYLPELTGHWEPTDSTPELSRRARGIPSYAILRHLGRAGVRELIHRHCRLAERLAGTLSAEPGIHILNRIHSNQVAIACGDRERGDSQTNQVLERIQDRGRAYPTHGEWAGRKIIRASIIGYAMNEEDVDVLSSEVIDAWRQVQRTTA
jgi:glutamate/tyrosine decarboxylase-like PLP-dependent enzyme